MGEAKKDAIESTSPRGDVNRILEEDFAKPGVLINEHLRKDSFRLASRATSLREGGFAVAQYHTQHTTPNGV